MRRIGILPLLMLVVACGAGDDGFVEPTGAHMTQIRAVVEAADWSKPEARSLTLDEFKFSPPDITFRLNQPYELTLTNVGVSGHSFVTSTFFDTVAVKGLIFADGEVAMPLLKSVSLDAGETKILVFVPVKAGNFPLICDQPLHETFGMAGTIHVE